MILIRFLVWNMEIIKYSMTLITLLVYTLIGILLIPVIGAFAAINYFLFSSMVFLPLIIFICYIVGRYWWNKFKEYDEENT